MSGRAIGAARRTYGSGPACGELAAMSRGTMLRLRIVSDQRRSLAERSTAVFSVEGGTIGRSADNDWVLPDPLRYVSAHHARVQFREGHYYLQDVSTNGVFVNDDVEPLAKRGSSGYRLANGDVLRMGAYQIVAALEQRQAQSEETGAAAVPTSIHALRTIGRTATDRDIGAKLNVEELLVPVIDIEAALPVTAYGQAVNSGRVQARRLLARHAHGVARRGGGQRTEERRRRAGVRGRAHRAGCILPRGRHRRRPAAG